MTAPRATFRADVLALHDELVGDGWQPACDRNGLDARIAEYWDALAGPSPDTAAGDDAYTVADLPPARYTRDDDGRHHLDIGFAHPADTVHPPPLALGYRRTWTRDGETVAPRDILRAIPHPRYALVVTVEFDYFLE